MGRTGQAITNLPNVTITPVSLYQYYRFIITVTTVIQVTIDFILRIVLNFVAPMPIISFSFLFASSCHVILFVSLSYGGVFLC